MAEWNVTKSNTSCDAPRALRPVFDISKDYQGPRRNLTSLKMSVDKSHLSHAKGMADTGTPIPDSWSWRKNGGNKIEKGLRNQGQCGGCWAFATASVLGDRFGIKYNIASPIPSTTWLISCGKPDNVASSQECLSGGNTQQAGEWLEKNGDKLESCWPFSVISSHNNISPDCVMNSVPDDCCSSCCGNSDSATIRFYAAPGSTKSIVVANNHVADAEATTRAIQRDIMYGGPVTASFQVPLDFNGWWNTKASNGDVYVPTTSSKEGGHAVVLTGWGTQDGKRYWEMRNSWGDSGDNGYCKFAFSLDTPQQFWTQIDIPIFLGIGKDGKEIWNGGVVSFQAGDLPKGYKSTPGTGIKPVGTYGSSKEVISSAGITVFGKTINWMVIFAFLLVVTVIIILVIVINHNRR